MQTVKEIGEAVRRERKRLGVTQGDLAMTAGTGLRFIVDLEKGKPTVRLGKVLLVLEALGLRLDLQSKAGAP
jgi:HTH-type transcriptional regulator / antitoxin HipB